MTNINIVKSKEGMILLNNFIEQINKDIKDGYVKIVSDEYIIYVSDITSTIITVLDDELYRSEDIYVIEEVEKIIQEKTQSFISNIKNELRNQKLQKILNDKC